jgi:oxygen-independent coproporphyrinogen III oxidase
MRMKHLYLHVPFCLRRCSYCDFAVLPTRRPAVAEWLEAIARELDIVRARAQCPDLDLSTIYVGGGTPSLLGLGAMQQVRTIIERRGAIRPDVEWTAEANPESFTNELAADWRAAGVNRISLGVQSFHAPALRWMGRLHGPEGAHAAMAAARAAGFDNINIDLIFALPESLQRDWQDDLRRGLELNPDHISLYGLSAEPQAALGRWVQEGRASLPPEEGYANEYLTAADVLSQADFEHYEVSNFARRGRESRHNRAYWEGASYLGIGPSAHSFHEGKRWWNQRSWVDYRDCVQAGRDPCVEEEFVGEPARTLERIWLGLRTASGLLLPEQTPATLRLLQQWQREGWARCKRECVRLTPSGWLLLDRLAVDLDDALQVDVKLQVHKGLELRGHKGSTERSQRI